MRGSQCEAGEGSKGRAVLRLGVKGAHLGELLEFFDRGFGIVLRQLHVSQLPEWLKQIRLPPVELAHSQA